MQQVPHGDITDRTKNKEVSAAQVGENQDRFLEANRRDRKAVLEKI